MGRVKTILHLHSLCISLQPLHQGKKKKMKEEQELLHLKLELMAKSYHENKFLPSNFETNGELQIQGAWHLFYI